jgi:hypothetical protein
MSSTVILKAAGLNTSPNELSVPEGSLSEATNVLIRRDGIVEQRRGFKLYGNAAGNATDRTKQLTTYRNRIIKHISNLLQYDSDGLGNFQSFVGNYLEASSSLRMKFIESNGNLYFTSSNGIQKLSSKTADTITNSSIVSAGAVKALDLVSTLNITPNLQTGFLPQDSAIAYRIVWGYKDVNGNLVLGSPSQQEVIYSYQINLMLQDYMRFLGVLDSFVNSPLTTARINDKNYVSTQGLSSSAGVGELRTKLIALAEQLDNDILYANSSTAPILIGDELLTLTEVTAVITSTTCRITYVQDPSTLLAIGQKVLLAGFGTPATSGSINGVQTITNVNSVGKFIEFTTSAVGAITGTAGTTTIPAATITNGICTITRKTTSTGLFSDYLSAASRIYLTGFSAGLGTGGTTSTLDGPQTVVSSPGLDAFGRSYITFNVSTTGTNLPVNPVIAASPIINSGELRAITQPPVVQIPPVHIDNMDVQAYLNSIITTLRSLPDLVISAADQLLLDTISLTTTTSTNLSITIPQGINSNYFYQIYRSSIFSASNNISINDVIPNDELQLVYEAYPTAGEISTGVFSIGDVTPDAFKGANLYTNNSTGEGILQANEAPPFALDINRYRNVVFYANTRTKHKSLLNLLGVQNMINDYNNGIIPSITITTATGANTYKFVTGLQEVVKITTVADVANSLNNKYFLLNSVNGTKYCFYFETTTATIPALGPTYTYIKVNIATGATANDVATAINNKLAVLLVDFSVSTATNVITITNTNFGTVTDSADVNTGFTISIFTQGRGEDAATKTVLLSTNISPSIAVDETARSLIRIINSNPSESIYGFYLSGAFDVPGKMLLESRNLSVTSQFYVTSNNATTGNSFSPALLPDAQISSITITGTVGAFTATSLSPIITTSTPHNLLNLDYVVIGNSNTTPVIDGAYQITYIDATHYQITVSPAITVAGTLGAMSNLVDVLASENETKPNRIYYSKLYQPEAVPVSNYFDVGAQDKAILRIMPLRDSLFVFKEDGLFRISGDSAPFQLNLFDSSFIVTAPDSVSVSNNIIYAWTNQGIQNLSEGGAGTVSRAIDNQILKLGSNNYLNFKTATWGVGYESDNSYLIWTVTNFDDVVATKGFRYSTLTRTWSTYNKTNTCGIISTDDKLYLGAGDVNQIEQERKLFDRTDFADREFISQLGNTFLLSPTVFKVPTVTGVAIGDVILQDQTLTCFEFNGLLNKLDLDSSIDQNDFFATLELKAGDNPRSKLLALSAKLDADISIATNTFTAQINDYTGSITTNTGATSTVITSTAHNLISGRSVLITGSNSSPIIDGEHIVTVIDANHFSIPVSVKIPGTTGAWQTLGLATEDLKTSYNRIITLLNADIDVSFNNYRLIDNNTIQEAIITGVDARTKRITVNLALQYLVGNTTIFKAIPSSLTYSPVSMGDPLNLKHLREATLMFQTRNITSATLSFATDLLPELIPVSFNLDGNGIFGHSAFGTGFFGGGSNSAPFRTFVPRQCQRCRFVVAKFEHSIAREDYRLLGLSITGEVGQSTRAYR